VTENCGQGHDPSQICCACTEKVKERLQPAEAMLEKIDLCALYVIIGTPKEQSAAEIELGELLLARVWDQAKEIITERMRAEALCRRLNSSSTDVTETP
jgi:hypothetical protein